MRRPNHAPRRARDPLADLAIEDLGERARDGRFAVQIGEREWRSKHRGLLERLLADMQEEGEGDATRR